MSEYKEREYSTEEVSEAHDTILALGKVGVAFAGIERAPRYPGGRHEDDAQHSYLLSLTCMEIAAHYYQELDMGLITQFCIVHDLVELESGDVKTFNITEEQRRQKAENEKGAMAALKDTLPPYVYEMLNRYEEQLDPEARFVKLVDKFLPAVVNIMAGPDCTFREDFGIATIEQLYEGHDARTEALRSKFSEFSFLHEVRELVSKSSAESVFGTD